MEKSDFTPFNVLDKNAHVNFANYIWSFEIFARASGITGQQLLKDSFLAKGGKHLQEVYFLLPESVEEPNNVRTATPYNDCVNLLKAYFKKKTSRTCEKYLLRQIKQEPAEDFQSFLKKIREQVKACEFPDQVRIDEEIVDQIVFGTTSDALRADILKTELSLSQVIDKAMLMEGVSTQMKVFHGASSSYNSVSRVDNGRFGLRCQNCSYLGHTWNDPSCPAKGRMCNKCEEVGHFAKCCSQGTKRKLTYEKRFEHKKKVRFVTKNEENPCTDMNLSDRNFVFMLTNSVYYNGEEETRVVVRIDGFEVNAVIDSGCPVTIVNNETYGNIVSHGFVEKDFKSGCNIPFYGYELNHPPIEIKGSCSVHITYGNLTIIERIYIAPYGRENLLGKKTAEKLGLLKMDVYHVKPISPFPKLRNSGMNVPINSINRKVVTKDYGVKPGFVPRFGLREFTVAEKHGPKCTLVSEYHGNELIRDASHLKKISDKRGKPNFSQNEGEEDVVDTTGGDAAPPGHTGRTRKPPSKLKYYVRH